MRYQQGFFSISKPCHTCKGEGRVIKDPCSECGGSGRVRINQTLSVKVPAGVETGTRLRLSGEGEAGFHGGESGDLYVVINVKPHPIFTREGSHLHCEMPISFVTAALGGELDVPTLSGRVKLKIPAETQTGKVFRLREKGVQSVHGGSTGDLLCKVVVETPVGLGRKQKELLNEFEKTLQEGKEKHNPRAHSWLDGVKKFFEDLKI